MGHNKEAKHSAITAFFDDAEARLAFLDQLTESGHEREAMTLSLVYIDRNAQALCWPSDSAGRNFVDALIRFGREPLMGLAYPTLAALTFASMAPLWKAIAAEITNAFPGPSYELMPVPSFEKAIANHISASQLAKLRPELWRTTVANAVYRHLRNPAIHGVGTGGGLYFSKTEWNGQPAPIIGFAILRNCARGLVAESRHRSEMNYQWFGNDAIVGLA